MIIAAICLIFLGLCLGALSILFRIGGCLIWAAFLIVIFGSFVLLGIGVMSIPFLIFFA